MNAGRRLRPRAGKHDLRVSRRDDEKEGFTPFNADTLLEYPNQFNADKPIFMKNGGKVRGTGKALRGFKRVKDT